MPTIAMVSSASSSVAQAEQLVARVGREHVLECTSVVTVGREPRPLEHLGDLLADHGDALDAVAEDVGGVEPEQPELPTAGSVGLQAPHGDRIERHVAVHGGPHLRTGEREQADGRRIGVVEVEQRPPACDTQLRAGHRDPGWVDCDRAHEREVVVGQPVEVRRDLGRLRRADAGRRFGARRPSANSVTARRSASQSATAANTSSTTLSISSRNASSTVRSVSRSISTCRCDVRPLPSTANSGWKRRWMS